MSTIYKQFDKNLQLRIDYTREHIKTTSTYQTALMQVLRECAACVAVDYTDEVLIAGALLNELLGVKDGNK